MIADNGNWISLSNNLAECKISLFGGHLISYRPKNEEHDIFWLGNLNKFDNLSAIRGGIPVCWPRFAAEELNNHFPRHGFARISNWNLKHIDIDENKIEINLSLIPDTKYDVNISVNLFIKITDHMEYSLETINLSDKEFKFSEALHAYFNVGDKDKTIIHGLSGCSYINKLDGKIYTQENDLQINKEFDAVFFNHTGNVEIKDTIFKRIIALKKIGSNSTIVWNPNKDLAEMSPGQYNNFICIEPANQGNDFVNLQPNQNHKITMIIDVKNI